MFLHQDFPKSAPSHYEHVILTPHSKALPSEKRGKNKQKSRKFTTDHRVKGFSRRFVNSIKRDAFHAMDHLPGWCTQNKASVLIDLVLEAKARKVVEIGVFGGKSLVPMAIALKRLGKGHAYGIDPWCAEESAVGNSEVNREWWTNLNYSAILDKLLRNIKDLHLKKTVRLIKASSADCPAIRNIDLLHIDGNHSEEVSFSDVMKWVPFVRERGIIVVDDVHWTTDGKSSQAKSVLWLDQHCERIAEYTKDGDDFMVWRKR